MKSLTKTTALALCAMLSCCTNDGYESGDGRYSDMRADFVEAQTDGSAAIVSFTTDDGESLELQQAIKPQWAETGDSAYRALIYYNKVMDESGAYKAVPVILRSVPVPTPTPRDSVKTGVKTDPVTFNSAWVSRSKRYLNLDLSLKTGQADDEDAAQSIGIVIDSAVKNADGSTTTAMTLYHDQGSVPEYYSSTCYISVPLRRAPLELSAGDTIVLNIQTYDKLATKKFVVGD